MGSSSRTAIALFWAVIIFAPPSQAAEPDGPAALLTRAEAVSVSIQNRIADKFGKSGDAKSEQKALADYYAEPDSRPLWVDENGLNDRAKAVMDEISKADDYGLRASDYALPKRDGFDANNRDAVTWLADAETKISIAVLHYARDARGGRLDPQHIDENLDPTLALPDPLQLLDTIAIRSEPGGLSAQLPARPAPVRSLAQGADRLARRKSRRERRHHPGRTHAQARRRA